MKNLFRKFSLLLCATIALLIFPVSSFSTVPIAPTLREPVNNATNIAVNRLFGWYKVSNALSYQFMISTDSTFQSNVFNSGTYISDSTYYTVGLSINTVYYWKVRAGNSEGFSTWSSFNKLTTAGGVNPLPVSLIYPANNATNVSQSVTLTWTSSTSATSYLVMVSTTPTFSPFCGGLMNATSYSANLLPNTLYYWHVNAVNQYGASNWLDTRTFTTGSNGGNNGGGSTTALAAPTLVLPINQATNVAMAPTLTWQTVTSASSYVLQVSANSAFSTTLVNQSVYTNSYTFSYLTSNTTYYWRVRAVNYATTGNWSATRSYTTVTLPAYTGQQVISTHPRIWLNASNKASYLALKNANTPEWQALKAKADQLKNYPVVQFDFMNRNAWGTNVIFFAYEGYGWIDATIPLAFAYQMTGDTNYSHKLMQLADEMIRATNDPTNYQNGYLPPNLCNGSYASRTVLPAAAIIYDWCYDQLGSVRKAQMNAMFNRWFDTLRSTNPNSPVYQRNGPATGNYYGGHVLGCGLMGLACVGDNSTGQTMVDFARTRFDGSVSANLLLTDFSKTTRLQAFEGGMVPYFSSLVYNGIPINGAPFKGGYNIQGWSYGTIEFSNMIDYLNAVKTATGEDLLATHGSWFSDMLKSQKNAILPGNNFLIDPFGDYGGNEGAVIGPDLAVRLAYVLGNTSDSAAAQSFAYSELAQNTGYGYYSPSVAVYPASTWSKFYYYNANRTQTPSTLVPYYSGFPNGYTQAVNPSGAIPKFVMRSNWSSTATWSSYTMGGAIYDDHQNYMAGHLFISQASSPVLIAANNWRGAAGTGTVAINGVNGIGYIQYSSAFNTLFVNDFYDYQSNSISAVGGQNRTGRDEVVAVEQNQNFSYVRSDLSSAYNNFDYPRLPADSVNRSVQKFYRNAVYLRSLNVHVIYDQIQMKNSTNANGQYDKHLRWHVVGQPTINGKSASSTNGNAKIFIHTLLPVNASIASVSLMNNPDNTFGSGYNYAFQSSTYRLEVRHPQNPLQVEYLTVLQPGLANMQEMTSANIAANDGLMKGARFDANNLTAFVLFNNRTGQTQQPIASTSYPYSGGANAIHLLCGMTPNAAYNISIVNNTIVIQQNTNGSFTATLSGALLFSPSQLSMSKVGEEEIPSAGTANVGTLENYPNPVADQSVFDLTMPHTGSAKVVIVNSLGQEITELYSGILTVGNHQLMFQTNGLPSGIYFCRAEIAGKVITKSFQIVK